MNAIGPRPSPDKISYAYARRTGLAIHVVVETIWRRVSWTEVAR